MDKISGIYLIHNKVNGKSYIGQTVNLNKRYGQHKYNLNHNRNKPNRYLQNAWIKYGVASFEFLCLEQVNGDSVDELKRKLTEREQYWVDKCQPQYNMNRSAVESMLGYKHTEETCNKQRELKKGNQNMKGHHHTDEARAKIREARSRQSFSVETRKKLSESSTRNRAKLTEGQVR